MNIVTLADCKERLSIDFDTKDNEITLMANSIESYLFFATGLENITTERTLNLAKEYILFKLYLDYYNAHTELDDRRLTAILKQLQVVALYEHS
jgi:hypothetical protein